jgi:hypothetical protein
MKYILTLSLSLLILCGFSQTKSLKRGLSYGHHTTPDLVKLSTGVSWYYNWYHQPEAEVISTYDDYGFDYVPMAWNGNFNKQAMHDFLSAHPDVKYILGWNEPNFKDQANMTPSQAAAQWSDIESLADEFGLEIVGPAVNYCGNCVQENGTTYTDPVKYLDDFFAACDGCRVDYIAIHCYMNNVSALQWYVGQFKKYGKPIWLTEFAAWEGEVTLTQQKSYMMGAVDYLENDPDVFRYAWFTGRHTGAPYIGILKDGLPGELTEVGNIYVNMPVHDPDAFVAIPAKIEAEAYNKMSGILLEMTEDVSGFANVGYIDGTDWLEYNIDVPSDGVYYLNARIASTQAGSIQILKDESLLATLAFPNNGGWQTWKSFNVPVTLTAGEQTIRLKAVTGGFNINWIEFKNEAILANEEELAEEISLFPNPAHSIVEIKVSPRWKRMEVRNFLGVKCYDGKVNQSFDMQPFSSGAYLFKFTDEKGRSIVRKVVRQ